MNKELIDALDMLEKEKDISKETLFTAIEDSLKIACKNHFGKDDNVKVEMDRETGDFLCYAEKTVVETADDIEDAVSSPRNSDVSLQQMPRTLSFRRSVKRKEA